jgi:F420-dependent oxidoreductase-like protein
MQGSAATVFVGVYAPSGWRGELSQSGTPTEQWAAIRDYAQAAESLGFDSLWVGDHLQNVPVPRNESIFEAWTVLTALSQCTERIRLGQIVTCAAFRHPAYLAKIASNLDVLSGGRLEFGIGAGWNEPEFRAYGFPWRPASGRIAYLQDTLEVVTRMWSPAAEATYEGRYVSVTGAQCDPKPVQQPRPPILVAGQGEQLTLRLVAKYADRANFVGSLETVQAKKEVLRRHCAEVGRPFEEVELTYAAEFFLRESDEDVEAGGSRSYRGLSFGDWRDQNLVGTPERVHARLDELCRAGIRGFILASSEMPAEESLRLLRDVADQLRADWGHR